MPEIMISKKIPINLDKLPDYPPKPEMKFINSIHQVGVSEIFPLDMVSFLKE